MRRQRNAALNDPAVFANLSPDQHAVASRLSARWSDKATVERARAAVQAAGGGWALAWVMLVSLCGDGIVPPRLVRSSWPEGWALLGRTLDAVAEVAQVTA